MIRKILITLVITLISVFASIASVFADAAINAKTAIELDMVWKLAGFVAGVVLPCVVWLTRELQKIKTTLENLPCKIRGCELKGDK